MDYKSKYPDLRAWRGHTSPGLQPCPFDIVFPHLFEVTSPHDSSLFLGESSTGVPEEYLPIYYLSRAPRDCPMRICMETGDIEMYDYWMSRPWLIEIQFSLFDDSYFTARYITPREMCQEVHIRLKSSPERSPLDRKLDAIKAALEDDATYKPRRVPARQKRLAEFMVVYKKKKELARKILKSASSGRRLVTLEKI